MAIKVNGTTVINDSRALQNVASVDATTAAAISAAGVGGGAGTLEAWVNFNGKSSGAIRADGNVSSVTDNGVGQYTVNYSTSFSDVSYAFVATCRGGDSSDNSLEHMAISNNNPPTSSTTRVHNTWYTSYFDTEMANVQVVR